MQKAVYSGVLIICLTALAMPAIAKGKPQKQHKPQKTEQLSEEAKTDKHKQSCQVQTGLPQLPSTTTSQISQQQTTQQSTSSISSVSQQSTEWAMTSEYEAESKTTSKQNLRSNRGGQLRGQARAQHVHQLNQAAKAKRAAAKCGSMQPTPASSGATSSSSATP